MVFTVDYFAGLLSGGAVVGVGVLCYYGLKESKRSVRFNIQHESDEEEESNSSRRVWPEYVRNRINKTYTYFGGSVALTVGSAVVVANCPSLMDMVTTNTIPVFVGELVALIGTQIWLRTISYTEKDWSKKHAVWALHCFLNGAIMAPLSLLGGPIVQEAALYTAAIVGGFSVVAACSPSKRYLNMGGILASGLSVVCVASLGTLIFSKKSFLGEISDSVSLFGGLALFSAYLLYDTQRLIENAENYPENDNYTTVPYDPINEHLKIYYDSLNVFIRILRIMVENQEKQDKKKKMKKFR